MRAISVIDNIAPKDNSKSLSVERGFSVMVETKMGRILVDCGVSGSVLEKNAEKLKVDLESIDILIISHHHFDHTGGLWTFLGINDKAKVYIIEPNFDQPKYAMLCNLIGVRIGFLSSDPKMLFKDFESRITFVDDDMFPIGEDLVLISRFRNNHKIPTINGLLFKYNNKLGNYEKDNFDHELAVILRPKDAENVMLISPCSHNGILNIVDKCVDVLDKEFEDTRKVVVVGGFHMSMNLKLYEYRENHHEVEKVAKGLKNNERLEKVYTGHCTGYYCYTILKNVNRNIDYFYCGDEIIVKKCNQINK